MFEAVLRGMSEGVLAVDRNKRLVLANPAAEKMFGIIEPQAIGKTIREAVRNNEIADLVEEVLKTKQAAQKEIHIVVPFEGDFIAHVSPLNEGGAACVLHDITDLRRLEKHRSEFVANVSHELKTPLTSIRSFVETLLLGAIDDKHRNLDFLRKIDKHANNLSVLIDDILELSKLEAKKELGSFGKVEVRKMIEQAVESVLDKAKKKSIAIEKQLTAEELVIYGIEDHLYRAILNLLDNAVNYTPEGGKVTVVSKKDGNRVIISVSDTGIGIPQEHLPRIFERFYRVDKARSRELGGTGLGLAIVKHVMNLHNGEVAVESVEGRGSKFTLEFPLT